MNNSHIFAEIIWYICMAIHSIIRWIIDLPSHLTFTAKELAQEKAQLVSSTRRIFDQLKEEKAEVVSLCVTLQAAALR